MTRSEFLKLMGSSAVLTAAGCRTICGCEKPRYALQLYSIHKIFWKDPVANLAALKAGGYDGVEFQDTTASRRQNSASFFPMPGLWLQERM